MASILDLVKKEMLVNSFKSIHFDNIPESAVVSELAYCFHPTVHEGRIPPYGALFCNQPIPQRFKCLYAQVPASEDERNASRLFADGRRSFMTYDQGAVPKLALFEAAFGDEYRLLELSESLQGLVMQRQETGLVKLIQQGEVFTVRDRVWSRKGTISDAKRRIVDCIGNTSGIIHLGVLGRLLQLCYYHLSPESIGATLVWCLLQGTRSALEIHSGIGLPQLPLSVQDAAAFTLIGHLLHHQDGAAIILPFGELECIGVHLSFTEEARQNVAEVRGTRHTSAARFTYDHRETIAFVVSHDGAVTVFSDGANVAELAIDSTWTLPSPSSAT